MLAGPIFSREVLTSPRQLRHYLIRSGYIAALFVLMYTAGQATFGWQQVRNIGDIARFGSLVFQVFSLVQMSLVLFFALLFAASNVAQEKDRKTLILLFMTDLHDREMVLGKLFASLLMVGVLIAASVPVFVMVHLLGGVSLSQIGWSLALCAATALAAGSWGSIVAFWRDKTFQTLAVGVLGLVLFLGLLEAVIALVGPTSVPGQIAALLNPYRALFTILNPLAVQDGGSAVSALSSVLAMSLLAVTLNVFAIWRLRIWYPPRTIFDRPKMEGEAGETATMKTRSAPRKVWSQPVIWREICTRAYGRKIFAIKLAYFVIAFFTIAYLRDVAASEELVMGMISPPGFGFVALALLTLLLVNAQAVTSLTTERDAKTLELLLATEISAREFIFGKLGGVFYNTKELILVPMALAGYFTQRGDLSFENFLYTIAAYLILVVFSAMLGMHSGLGFDNSRSSIATSLGTMFFLFIGVFIFMMLLVEARSSFFIQFQSFIVFIGIGSIALYASLTHTNPSVALTIAAGSLPFLTFYSITEFLLNGTLGVSLCIVVAYGFATIAMLIPAISEFDVALGRTTLDKG